MWIESMGRFMPSGKGMSGHLDVPLQPALASLLSITENPSGSPQLQITTPELKGLEFLILSSAKTTQHGISINSWAVGWRLGGQGASCERGLVAEPQHPPSLPYRRRPHQHGAMNLVFVFHVPLLPANVIKQRSFHHQPPSRSAFVLLAQAG